MSRLGDLIKSQRLRYNMTPKQLARKCGVTEAFVLEVESGKRIPNDVVATRMLKAMGTVDTVMNDLNLESASVPPAEAAAQNAAPKRAAEKPAARQEAPAEPSDAWQDALSGMIKRVPVLDARGKTVGHRMLATEAGRIEGARPETVFYLQAQDNSMRAYRILEGDLLLCVPAPSIAAGGIMAVTYRGETLVRMVRKLEGNRAELMWFDSAAQSLVVESAELGGPAKVARVEFVP